ncbi:unnamed protein product [Rotaria sordida]|uniref:Sodium-coupled monocarboxylate transporter 1 n=1 Tax=Rotaria sordida TaxID=392033 RepID=A0A819YIL8_9BILA|nr:unnamed protein product [Rotaria sordida]
MAIVLYAPALALSQTTGLNIWLSVVSIGVICTFYSSVGGMKAIIWTDVLQAVVIVIGLLAVIVQGLITVGGFKQTFSIASQGGRIQFDSISFDPRTRFTVWSLVIGGCFNSLSTYGFNQTQIQRYIAIRSTRGAKQALLIDAIGGSFIVLLTILIGVIMYAYYADCDPYTNKQIEHIDQILPYFVMEVLGDKKGIPGIFLACVFSGSLSTISSGLNSLAAVIIEDFYKGLMSRQLSDERQALQLWMFLGAQITQNQMESDSLPLSIANCSGTMNSTLMNWTTTTMVSTFLKRDLFIDLYSVSYLWYSPIAVGTVVLVGVTVSYLTHPLQSHEIDPKLIVPVGDVCCCFLPKRWREWLQCGIDYETYRKRQNDNNELEMVTNDTQRSGRESPIVPLLDTISNVFVTGRIKLQAKLISPTHPNKTCNFD